MIMNRTIMRMAAVTALNNFRTAPYPTLAGTRIFDSKIEAVETTQEDQIFPMVVLYTDYDRDFWTLKQATTNNRDRRCTLTLELLVAQIMNTNADDEAYDIRFPVVDSEIETALDVLESQCFQALQADNVGANCWRHLMQSIDDVISRRGASVETGQRLAARQITIEGALEIDTPNGVYASPVGSFFTTLENDPEYMERLPEVQQLLIKHLTQTDAEQRIEAMGLSDETGALLGYERGPQPNLGTPVTYFNALQGNQPL